MAKFSSESMDWLDKLEAVNAAYKANPTLSQTGLAAKFGFSPANASYYSSLHQCLDQTAIEKIRLAAKGDKAANFSFNNAVCLIALKGKVADLPGAVHTVLDQTLSQGLATQQIKSLVEWIKDGKPVAEFDPNQKPPQPTSSPSLPTETKLQDTNPEPEDVKDKELEKEKDSSPKTPEKTKTKSTTLFWSVLAGVSPISKVKTKLEKEESLSLGEKLLVLVYTITKGPARLVGMALFLVFLIIVAWFGWAIYQQGYHSLNGTETKLYPEPAKTQEVVVPVPTTQPTPMVSHTNKVVRVSKKTKPQPTQPAPQAWQPPQPGSALVDETQSYLEREIASVPSNSRIKDFPFGPDTSMKKDEADRCLADLPIFKKYSFWRGNERNKVITVVPSPTLLTLTYRNADGLGSLLGTATKLDIYWGDVRAIHCNAIETKGDMLYQCSLVVADWKIPIAFQCASAGDLERLVSALEFWIKSAQGDKLVPVNGLPYLYQGLTLDDEGLVIVLWANGPADKAGLRLGDGVWSLGQDLRRYPGKSDLETELEALTPGEHSLFMVTPEAWRKGQEDRLAGQPESFQPIRQRIKLVTP